MEISEWMAKGVPWLLLVNAVAMSILDVLIFFHVIRDSGIRRRIRRGTGPGASGYQVPGSLGGGVYFIQGEATGPIKIGYSQDVSTRLADLQAGSPVALKVLVVLDADQSVERGLHKRFAFCRQHGEWFSPEPELVTLVTGLMED